MKTLAMAACAALLASFATVGCAATVNATNSHVFSRAVGKPSEPKAVRMWIKSLGLYEKGFSLVFQDRQQGTAKSGGDLSVSYDDKSRATGHWDWAGDDAVSFVVLKSKNKFVALHFLPGIFGTDFDAAGLGLDTPKGKGHAVNTVTVWSIEGTMTSETATAKAALLAPTPVPLPAGGFLLLGGLGLLALKRRKAA